MAQIAPRGSNDPRAADKGDLYAGSSVGSGDPHPLMPMSERALLLLRDSCSGEDEG